MNVVSPVYTFARNLPRVKKWQDFSNVTLPIKGEGLRDFKKWARANPYDKKLHQGFDLSAYEVNNGPRVVGLPPATPVYAMLDGVVIGIFYKRELSFYSSVYLLHSYAAGSIDTPVLTSCFSHIALDSVVARKKMVRRGELIGQLMPAFAGFKPKLHIGLFIGFGAVCEDGSFAGRVAIDSVDPEPILFPNSDFEAV